MKKSFNFSSMYTSIWIFLQQIYIYNITQVIFKVKYIMRRSFHTQLMAWRTMSPSLLTIALWDVPTHRRWEEIPSPSKCLRLHSSLESCPPSHPLSLLSGCWVVERRLGEKGRERRGNVFCCSQRARNNCRSPGGGRCSAQGLGLACPINPFVEPEALYIGCLSEKVVCGSLDVQYRMEQL